MLDQATINAYEGPVNAALSQAEAEAQSVSDPTLRAQVVWATGMLRTSVDKWEGAFLDEVQAGHKNNEWWTDYGKDLLDQAARYLRDNRSFYAQWSHAINVAGDAAQAVVDYVADHLNGWQEHLDQRKVQLQELNNQEGLTEQLANQLWDVQNKLPADVHDLLFGRGMLEARDQLSLLNYSIQKAQAFLDALKSGAQALFVGTDLQLAPNQSFPGLSGARPARLGNPIVITGTVAVTGLLALLALIGGLVTWMLTYYQHIAQVTQSKTVQDLVASGTADIAIINDPKASPQAKAAAQKHLDAVMDTAKAIAHQKPPDPWGGVADWAKQAEALAATVIKGVIVGTVIYVGWTNREVISGFVKSIFEKLTRKKNPRRRALRARA